MRSLAALALLALGALGTVGGLALSGGETTATQTFTNVVTYTVPTVTVTVTAPTTTTPPPSSDCSYYVSPSGADGNPGTLSAPWKTVLKVNSTAFTAGQIVCFEGGQIFSDANLIPSSFGTASVPISYGSYGTGKALFTRGAWIPANGHDLVFQNLDLSSQAGGVFASSSSGTGTYGIVLRDSVVHDSPYAGLNFLNGGDHDLLLERDSFRHLGDSCLLLGAKDSTVRNSTISDCGFNTALNYGKHGIYAKAENLTLSGNEIFGPIPRGQAFSIRAHGDKVFGNTVHDLCCAVGFFDYDKAPSPQGTSYVYDNRFWNITSWAFYYGGQLDPQGKPPSVSFVVASNTFLLASTEAVNLSEVPSTASMQLVNNIFSGSFGSAYRGCGTCSEHHNDWNGGSSNIPSGTGDIRVNPQLSAPPALLPSPTSPVIDAGTTNVPGLSYVAVCDGHPLHYCGLNPEMGLEGT